MERRTFVLGIAAVGCVSILASSAFAEEKTSAGEVWVTLKGADYAKPFFDGTEYENHEFEKNGTKLVIRIEDYNTEYTFELRSSLGDSAPVTITTIPKKFRATRVSGSRERRMVKKLKVTFKKDKK